MSARITVTDEMIEQGREAREGHYLRVSPVSCTCGWRSDTYIEADGLPRFEAHLVELALEAAAPAIAAQALREAADAIDLEDAAKQSDLNDLDYYWTGHYWESVTEEWLRARAGKTERGES